MAVDDLWYLTKRGPNDERIPSARHGRGKRWRVRYTDDQGVERQPLFDKKEDAKRHDAAMRTDVARGVYVDQEAGKVTVKKYAEEWRKGRLHADSTAQRVERALRVHVYPVLGGMAMARVKSSHVQGWVKDRSRLLEPSTLRVVYSYIVSMFNTATVDRVIGWNPCQGIQLPDILREDLWVPTADQVHGLSDALAAPGGERGRYQAQPVVAAGSGLRQGEVWGLELEHVDFLRRKIHVVQQLKVVSGREPFLALPKGQKTREVDLSQVVAEEFARHLEAFPVVEVEIDDETDPRKPVRRMSKLIFLSTTGTPIHRSSWPRVWLPAVAAAGLPKGTGMHALRHYYATLLIFGGASVKTVQRALGHSTPTITLNTYLGLRPDAIDTTRALIDSALRRPAKAGSRVAR